MGLGDVAGVFSRYFIVGFFLPAFTALMLYGQSASPELLPNTYEIYGAGTQVAVIAGAALVLGLLLLGLNYPILRLFEGYPLVQLSDWLASRKRKGKVQQYSLAAAKWLLDELESRQVARWNLLDRQRRDKEAAPRIRNRAAWQFDRCFPAQKANVLPTGLGNSIRAFETHSARRWGLDGIAVGPRLEA